MENEIENVATNENNNNTQEIKKLDKEIVLNMVARAIYNQLRQDLDSGEFMINENCEIVPGPNFKAITKK